MRLAVFLNIKCSYYDGQYWAEEAYYQYWLYIAQSFSHVYLCLSVKNSHQPSHFKIDFDPQRVTIVPLPYYASSQQLYTGLPGYLKKVKHIFKPYWHQIDAISAVVPNPFGLYLVHLAKQQQLPCALYIRGNLIQTVRYEYAESKLKWLSLTVAYIMEFLTRKTIKNTLTFVVGRELHQRYQQLGLETIPIVTSLISQDSIVPVKQLEPQKHYRILHVGRFSKEKGVNILIDAFEILRNRGISAELELVGDGPQREVLQQMARDKRLNITFSGFVPVGECLDKKYQNSDLFVLPSFTEGFPKVLLEAMANGTPIVTTDVGSIPQYMSHSKDCLMVSAQQTEALADAMEKLLNSTILRESIRNQALETIRALSIERSSEIFTQAIKKRAVAH